MGGTPEVNNSRNRKKNDSKGKVNSSFHPLTWIQRIDGVICLCHALLFIVCPKGVLYEERSVVAITVGMSPISGVIWQ